MALGCKIALSFVIDLEEITMNRRHFLAFSLPVLLGGIVSAVSAQTKSASTPSTSKAKENSVSIRPAKAEDVRRMVELSDMKRTEYAQYSPIFWHKAAGAAEKQLPFFQAQLEREQNIVLVAEEKGQIEGFVIASVVDAPPVYNPSGKVCMVDDFAVSAPELWATLGQALLADMSAHAKTRGAVLSVVVCGHLDKAKRLMLQDGGSTIASEWYVKPII